jgi:hypothetical protein
MKVWSNIYSIFDNATAKLAKREIHTTIHPTLKKATTIIHFKAPTKEKTS